MIICFKNNFDIGFIIRSVPYVLCFVMIFGNVFFGIIFCYLFERKNVSYT